MASRDDVLTRVDAELTAGRAWRAKEIIRGTIAGGRAEPAILECYGRLLEQLGERVEAGKYLFLSGIRKPEYTEPIAVFRKRHAKRTGKGLVSLFPAAIRRQEFDKLSPTLQNELATMGIAADLFGPRKAAVGPTSWSESHHDSLGTPDRCAVHRRSGGGSGHDRLVALESVREVGCSERRAPSAERRPPTRILFGPPGVTIGS